MTIMKKEFTNFFGLDEDEIELKEVATAGISIFVALGFVFLPLFL